MISDTPVFVGKNNRNFLPFVSEKEKAYIMADNRIPSLLCLKNGEFAGRVVAVADKASCGADSGRIEIAARISLDGGNTFGALKTIFSPPILY